MKAGWQTKKLEQLSKKKDAIVSGPFGSNLKVSDYKAEGIPILRLQNIGKGYFIDKSIKFINEEKAEELKYHSFVQGDIALAKLGIPIGKTCIIPSHFKSGIITADIVRIRPDLNIVDYKYLEYFLNTDLSVAQLTGNISGATRPRVNLSDVRNIEIPLPPLPEQQRIVVILDEVFEYIAIAVANAKKNLNNARGLFESTLQSVYTSKGAGWVETKLGLVYDVRDGTHDSPKYHATGYPLITSKNLKREGLDFDDIKLISEEDYRKINARSLVHKGDVLFAMIGTIGNPTVVISEPNFAIKNVALFKLNHSQSSNFLKYYLDSQMVISKMMDEAKGTTQKFVGLGYLRDFPIHLPPLETQQRIVSKLDELSAETKKLEAIYQQKLTALDELKKSILNQAFSGQLHIKAAA